MLVRVAIHFLQTYKFHGLEVQQTVYIHFSSMCEVYIYIYFLFAYFAPV